LAVSECELFQNITELTCFRPGQSLSRLDLVFSNEEGMMSNLESYSKNSSAVKKGKAKKVQATERLKDVISL